LGGVWLTAQPVEQADATAMKGILAWRGNATTFENRCKSEF
jgi:hypothetical protein